jgi:hypothetical protein
VQDDLGNPDKVLHQYGLIQAILPYERLLLGLIYTSPLQLKGAYVAVHESAARELYDDESHDRYEDQQGDKNCDTAQYET